MPRYEPMEVACIEAIRAQCARVLAGDAKEGSAEKALARFVIEQLKAAE